MAPPLTNPSAVTGLLAQKSANLVQTYHKISSERGLASITTLIVGEQVCVIIDPPFLIPDAEAVIAFKKEKTALPLAAVFVTHQCVQFFISFQSYVPPENHYYSA